MVPSAPFNRKCLACGSEEHRQKECKPPRTGVDSGGGGRSPHAPKSSTEPEGETSPKAVNSIEVAQGQPVMSWEALLQAAAEVAGAAPVASSTPALNVVALRGLGASSVAVGGVYALVDSGATHPLRRAGDDSEWRDGNPVLVNLAGGEKVELKMNDAGTLLVPPMKFAGEEQQTSSQWMF